MWSEEDSNIIQDYLTFLEDEKTRTKRLRDAGPTGEPWPKRPKMSARVLDGDKQNKQKTLCGEELHQYLIQNCVEERLVCMPAASVDNPATLEDITPSLIANRDLVKQHGRSTLRAYIDFGLLLRQAFALFQLEKAKGCRRDRRDTWKSWLQEHVNISETEAKRCREMAALLAPFPRFRKLSLTYTELYNRKEHLRSLLECPGPHGTPGKYAKYWSER